jgi:hypothetical protein
VAAASAATAPLLHQQPVLVLVMLLHRAVILHASVACLQCQH